MTRDEWLALAERCETAKGPDREIDASIYALLGHSVKRGPVSPYPRRERTWCLRIAKNWSAMDRLTASLDAITALIERELPGSTFKVGRDGAGANYAQCAGKRITEAATPTLALCAAFCRAMAEKGERG